MPSLMVTEEFKARAEQVVRARGYGTSGGVMREYLNKNLPPLEAPPAGAAVHGAVVTHTALAPVPVAPAPWPESVKIYGVNRSEGYYGGPNFSFQVTPKDVLADLERHRALNAMGGHDTILLLIEKNFEVVARVYVDDALVEYLRRRRTECTVPGDGGTRYFLVNIHDLEESGVRMVWGQEGERL